MITCKLRHHPSSQPALLFLSLDFKKLKLNFLLSIDLAKLIEIITDGKPLKTSFQDNRIPYQATQCKVLWFCRLQQ